MAPIWTTISVLISIVVTDAVFATLNCDGLDHHVQIRPPQEPTSTKLKHTKKKGAKIAMKYVYEFLDKVNGSRFFSTTDSSISDYRTVAVAGRNTRVFRVIEVEKRGTNWREKGSTEPIVPKVMGLDANRCTERQIQGQLFTDIQSFCGNPDRKSDDRLHSFADLEAAGIIQAFKAELQDKEGTPVDYLPTVGDAFTVLGQCVVALRLMFCAGWVHRDISVGNVLALQDANGGWKLKLADLEYAKAFKDGSPPTTDPKTGTPYFMAHEILSRDYVRDGTQRVQKRTLKEKKAQQERRKHINIADSPSEEYPLRYNFQHDLESVFWIALWIITARIDHTPSIRHANLIFTSTTHLSMPVDRRRAFDRHININGTLSECLLEPLLPLVGFLEDVRDDLYAAAFSRGEKVAWQDKKSYSFIHAQMSIYFAWTPEDTHGWGDVPLALPDSKILPPAPENAAEAAGVLSASCSSMGPPTLPVGRVEQGHGAKSLARGTSNKHSRPGEDQDQPEGSFNCSRKRGRSADREGV
ncbi:hypothetical protein H1R20_g6113, partial [Candolleomyces eurysporus]